jgi:hypothetical protein
MGWIWASSDILTLHENAGQSNKNLRVDSQQMEIQTRDLWHVKQNCKPTKALFSPSSIKPEWKGVLQLNTHFQNLFLAILYTSCIDKYNPRSTNTTLW